MAEAKRILVVDDEPLVTRGCMRILGEEGYDVSTACTGQEGLSRVFGEYFDLVVTDLRLPDMDGMELVRALKSRRPAVAVVIITGYGSVPSAVEAVKLGALDYIEKPFTPRQIVEVVERALAASEGKQRAGGESSVVTDVIGRALATAESADRPKIEASLVREVLRLAARDPSFGQRLMSEGSHVLSGFALSPPAKAAILSGDIAWIEKRCGELSPDERKWLEQRLARGEGEELA